jgi:predicted PurR-regulated permease PerM
MKQAAWFTLVVALTLLVLILLWQFSISIILFVLSLAVAAALRPIINDIAIRTRSKRVAMGLVYSLVIGSIVVLLIVVGQLLFNDLQKVTDDFAVTYAMIKNEWPRAESLFRQTVAEQLPTTDNLYQALTSEEGLIILTEEGGPGQGFFSSLGYIGIILVISVYWSADQLRFERIAVSLFPAEHRPKALHIWRAIERGVGAYLRSETLQSLLALLLLGLGYGLIGLKYPALFAVWGAVVRLIPWFGVLIAILPLLLGLGSSPITGLLAIVYTIVVLLVLKRVIEPRIIDRQRNTSLLIVVFVIILAEAFGFIGVLLAPPLAVAVQILMRELYPLFARRYSQELSRAFELKKRLSRLRRNVSSSDSSDETMRYVNQLYQLVRQTIAYMQKY